jgi:hypothetical protein
MKEKPQTTQKNKLILPVGGKGGVGKTVTILTLIEALIKEKKAHALVDTDTENEGAGGIIDYAKHANQIDLRDHETVDAMLLQASKCPITVLDLPANAAGDFFAWIEHGGSKEVLDGLNLELWIIGVVTDDKNTLKSVQKWIEQLGEKNYIIALNRGEAKGVKKTKEKFFHYYYQPENLAEMEALIKYVVEIPALPKQTMAALREQGSLFSEAKKKTEISLIDKSRIGQFLEIATTNWKPFVEIL